MEVPSFRLLVLAGVVVLGGIGIVVDNSGSDDAAAIDLTPARYALEPRDINLNSADFDLSSIWRQQRTDLRRSHQSLVADCMRVVGFAEETGSYLDAEGDYEDLAITPDRLEAASAAVLGDEVHEYEVELSDGSVVVVVGSWTPETCWWQAYEVLGTSPVRVEALRRVMAELTMEADSRVSLATTRAQAHRTVALENATLVSEWLDMIEEATAAASIR